ncbi:MAG: STT3 domain-containing protein [Candidatus Micrarchaeia archaeon]
MIERVFAAAITILLVLVPGLLLSWAVFYKLPFGRFVKFFFGIIFGMLAAPALSVLEFTFLGIGMSTGLVFANSLLVALASLALIYKQRGSLDVGHLVPKSVSPDAAKNLLLRNKALAVLLIVVMFGFYGRIATSWNPVFFEFDPYYYDFVTEMIVKGGSAPVMGPDAYFPQEKFHRDAPLMQYMTAGWYMVYQSASGIPFDKFELIKVIQLYPALVGALLSFLAFVMMREETGNRVALLVAAFFAFTPQLIKKLSAGVSEQQPFGIFLIMLVFALYALAIKTRSYRMALVASAAMFFTMIGTLQYIFPFMVLTGFIFIMSVLEFVSGTLDRRGVAINAIIVAGAVLGNVVLKLYQAAPIDANFLVNGVYLLLASLVPSVAFLAAAKFGIVEKAHAAGRRHKFSEAGSRFVLVGAVFAVLFLAFALTPLSQRVTGYVDSVMGISITGKPILKTVQEEGGANPSYDEPSYGFFHGFFGPQNLLLFVTMLVSALMVLDLLAKKKNWWALASGGAAFALVFLNGPVDWAVWQLADLLGASSSFIVRAFTENDTLIFMAVSVAAASISYLVSGRKNKIALFTLLVFFPTAFIGLQKVKYTLHLAFALCILFGFLLAESSRVVEELSALFGLASRETALRLSGIFFFVMGAIMASSQFVYAVGSPVMISCDPQVNAVAAQFDVTGALMGVLSPGKQVYSSLGTLCYGSISQDWMDTTKWMRESTPQGARFMSWWDYGHWTTFFGERYTVIDPNNVFDEYDQEVAHALVGNSFDELRRTMAYHRADYLMLDSELVPKWGALTYLSGTFGAVNYNTPNGVFNGLYREPDPKNNYNTTPGIVDWEKGPGQSVYEQEHYFENIYAVFTGNLQANQIQPLVCPGKFERPAYYSTLTGALYCLFEGKSAEETQLFFLKDGRTGEQVPLQNPRLIKTGNDPRVQLQQLAEGIYLDVNPASSRSFLNLNPDLKTVSGGKYESKLYGAMFTQFFFCDYMGTCETLKEKGFEYAYHSPNGQVKIFKRTQ